MCVLVTVSDFVSEASSVSLMDAILVEENWALDETDVGEADKGLGHSTLSVLHTLALSPTSFVVVCHHPSQ